MIKNLITNTLAVFTLIALTGCASGIVATGAATTAYVANQEHSITQQAKDLHIKAAIKDKLIQENLEYLKDIEVNVVNSEVLLLGIVSSQREKRKLFNYAKETKYVRRIYNKLIVDDAYSFRNYFNDSIVANAIRARLIASKNTYLSKINIEVFNNVVYVFGLVGTDEEKFYAEQIARTGKGVLTVFSFIHVDRKA
ncbi:MAG: BON domain-containing protein [Proteobacteria bacterium]|nr:BON domain-containing protein [Pseudomonadota bacterium]